MVELMESWFLGDPEKLAAYFGGNFNAGAVPRRPVEDIPKKEVLVALDRAVKDTPKKKYLKARDSKELLRYIRLDIVRNAPAPNCDGLLRRLESLSPQPREPLLDASG